MKNKYATHFLCLATCALAFLNVDYASIGALDVCVMVVSALAAAMIIINIVLERRRKK